MSNQSARSFRTEGALRRSRMTSGPLTIDWTPIAQPAPSCVGPVPIALPRYPGVLARTFEGGLCFARQVPVIYRLPLRG